LQAPVVDDKELVGGLVLDLPPPYIPVIKRRNPGASSLLSDPILAPSRDSPPLRI